MDSHRVKTVNDDKRSRKRLRFATTKQKSKHASADVYRRYKRQAGATSAATREETVHHTKAQQRPAKRKRLEDNSDNIKSLEEEANEEVLSEETTFAQELELAMDRNASEVFRMFYNEIWPLVRSLAELVHHGERIVEIMLRHLLSPEDVHDASKEEEGIETNNTLEGHDGQIRYQVNHATTDILHLLAVLARDLRHEIHQWLHTCILPRIVNDLLNPPLPSSGKQPVPLDVPIVEAAFRTIAYIFRYDAEQLLLETGGTKEGGQPCLESLRQYYGSTLANKRELIRRLAAETYAPLVRKLKAEAAKKRHLRRVLRALNVLAANQPSEQLKHQLCTDAVDGISRLCFEVVKGVAGDFNSKGTFVLDCVLSSITDVKNDEGLSCEVASSLFNQLLKFLKPDKAARLIASVKSSLEGLNLSQNSISEPTANSGASLLRLATEILSFGVKGEARNNSAKDSFVFIVRESSAAMLNQNFGTKYEHAIAKLLCAAWLSFESDESFLDLLRKTLAMLLGVDPAVKKRAGKMKKAPDGFWRSVADYILPFLPLESTLGNVGSLLLETALSMENHEERLALVHGVACFRERTGDRGDSDDDTFFPGNAHFCELGADLVSSLLESVLFDNYKMEHDETKLIVATRCCAFLVASTADGSCFKRLCEKTLKWLSALLHRVVGEKESTSSTRRLLFASTLEALTRLGSIALDRSTCDKAVTATMMRVRSDCEKYLLRNPSSVVVLKSCALHCATLSRLSAHLTDDSNPIFDALTPNLYQSSHFIRQHSLKILASFPKKPFVTNHADLDLREDLDEEPSFSVSANPKKGPVGACDVLDILLQAESLPVDLHSERPLVSLLSRVEVLGRSGKMPPLYADVAASHLMGLLYVKFSPTWEPAIKTLAVILTTQESSTWPFIFGRLVWLMESRWGCEGDKTVVQDIVPNGFDPLSHTKSWERWESSGGENISLFLENVQLANEEGKVSFFESRHHAEALKSLWGLFQLEPSLIVNNSRQMIPLVLRFFEYQYFQPSDPDSQEIFQSTLLTERPIRRKDGEKTLLPILKAFAILKGPEQLVSHRILYRIFVALLGHYEAEIAKIALDCVFRFKSYFIMPYADSVKGLFEKGKLREAMMALKEQALSGKILVDHRPKLACTLARILSGRLSSKSGFKSIKDSPAARRTAVFSFVSGFSTSDEDVFPFIFLATRRYLPSDALKRPVEDMEDADRKEFRSLLCSTSMDEIKRISPSVHEGFLNVLSAIISQMGYTVVDFVPCFLSICLALLDHFSLKASTGEMGGEEEKKTESDDRASKVRSQCMLRLAEMFEKYGTKIDFSPYMTRMWSCLDRSLALLPQLSISADKPPSLLKMLVVLSQNENLRVLLQANTTAIQAGFLCLSQSNSFAVVNSVLTLVENVVEMACDQQGTPGSVDSLLTIIPILLRQFELRFKAFGTTPSWKRELSILSKVCQLSKPGTEFEKREMDSLASLLIPFLQFKSRSSEQDRLHILGVLESIIPSISQDSAESLFSSISILLGPFKSGAGYSGAMIREKLAASLAVICDHHLKNALLICQTTSGLCAVNRKVIGEIDADAVVSSLKDLRENENKMSWSSLILATKSTKYLSPLIRSCFHLLFHEDGVIARSSFYALKDLVARSSTMDIENATEGNESWEKFLEQSVIPMIRSGLASRAAAVRRFFILLTADIAKTCKSTESPHLLGDLNVLLCEEEPDLDFFMNITHVQIHRRTRSLARLRKLILADGAESVQFSIQSLSGVLIPIVLHPIYENKTKLEEPFALEAIATLGALTTRLPWKKYQDQLWTLLAQVERQPEQEKYIIGAICAVLGGFHFDVGNPYGNDEEDANVTSVWNALDNRIIPRLETLLTKEKTGKKGEKVGLVRPQVILALTGLYKKLPNLILRRKLPRLLTVISDALKRRDSNCRDAARSTLAKLSVDIGVEYLPDILRELAVTLKEGYKLHVRAAAVHSVLLELSATDASGTDSMETAVPCSIDSSVPALIDLLQQDLFGHAQTRKDAEYSQVRYVKEAGGSKSLHSIEIIASMINIEGVGNEPSESMLSLASPLLSRMQLQGQSSKQVRQVKECLGRVVQGLSKNSSFTSRAVLPFLYTTIKGSIEANTLGLSDEKTPKEENGAETVEWRPSEIGASDSAVEALKSKKRSEKSQRKVLDGSDAPKLTGSFRNGSNISRRALDEPSSIATVLFGLQLLRQALRKGVKDKPTERLNPFVPLLTECICNCRDTEVVLSAMRCLGDLRASVAELPDFDTSSEALASKTLDLLIGSGGNEELLQASFKMMTYLFEGYKKQDGNSSGVASRSTALSLSEEQIELLLSFLQTSLTKAAQHNPAMNLIKALVARQVISPGMYDLMAVILKQAVQSHKETLRHQASIIYVRFLMSYPMTTVRMEKELKQLLINIQYEAVDGRHSAINMVGSVLKKFPEPVVVKYCQLFFVPLTMQLGNDESEEGRRTVSNCISTLLGRLPTNLVQSLLDYSFAWGASPDARLQRVSFSVLGIFVDSCESSTKGEANLNKLLELIQDALETKGEWEIHYFALLLLEKIQTKSPKKVASIFELWLRVVKCLEGTHPWVVLAALRLISAHLLSLEPASFLEEPTPSFLKKPGNLFDLTRTLCLVMDCKEEEYTDEGSASAIKCLTFSLKASNRYPELCFAEGDEPRTGKHPVRWLMTRLSQIAKPKGTKRRQAIFKTFAAFAKYGDGVAFEYLDQMIEPLFRVERETRNEHETTFSGNRASEEDPSDESLLAKDVLHLLEQSCPSHDNFVDAYGAVKKNAQEKKTKRLEVSRAEAARSPRAAAEIKVVKQAREKQRRKRRIEERRQSRGGRAKRRHHG